MSSSTSLLPVNEIIQRISPALAETILTYIQQVEKEVFTSTMIVMSEVMKYRPQIWKTWPKTRQREWLWTNLRQRRFAETAAQILQEWFFGQRAEMMNQFLDVLGISHDKEGSIDGDLPETLDAKKVNAAIDVLLKEFPGEEVALYLHLFQRGQENGWKEISEALASDSRLKF
ncbi:MAG: hypothetical protein LBV12_07615 [Puniceicoccales bacterium]|jgi:hypothetical protein|nr:hypothetical protein [Puniceicoccales bacterium]